MKKEKFCLEEATIDSIHTEFKNGSLTCKELIKKYIDRIEKCDKIGPMINSVIMINKNAFKIADELDEKFKKSGLTGPLHGIPVLLKDNINLEGTETTAGSISLKEVKSEKNAFITKKLKDAGAIIIAKVNLHEFAIWGETVSSILGQTLNPYDLTRTPGGSSGGTGAAVAMNFGLIGIGTDTVNSVRSPASACNLVGFRPTVGLVSRSGIIPYSLTQDTAGPIMRTVEDTAKVLDAIVGYDVKDPMTAWSIGNIPKTYTKYLNTEGLNGKRIGVLKSFFGNEEIHKQVNDIIYSNLKVMEDNGAEVVNIYENIDADKLIEQTSVHLYELKEDLNEYLKELGSRSKVNSLNDIIKSKKYHKGIEKNIKFAETIDRSMPEYNKRIVNRIELQNLVMELMAKYKLDAILYPHQKRPVVKVGESQVDRNGVLGAITGFPSCVLPAGFTNQTETAPIGIPVGIEFLTREWNESVLFEIAYGLEQSTKNRKSPVINKNIV
ncbi:amidase family protein [Senegalia massiliensis]|uniref:Amidase n=1 Tax=Senegalia massiliensis TaxID=1720316 RepID=A0A845R366_9CLOT|nr:amidase family protein [Senegalia massiliensis]NBI08028.1 amidase [Senegalia massiliensis]